MSHPATRSGRRASQRTDELEPFIDILRREGARSYLEIGARHGDTFHEIMLALPPGSRGVAVDLGGGAWGTPKSVPFLREAVKDLKDCGYDASLILGDSAATPTIQAVQALAPFDAVFIDGDHRYNAVRSDWLTYGRMGRIVAFHDIAGAGQRDTNGNRVEVPRLWAEIRRGHDVQELIGDGSLMGIGVVFR